MEDREEEEPPGGGGSTSTLNSRWAGSEVTRRLATWAGQAGQTFEGSKVVRWGWGGRCQLTNPRLGAAGQTGDIGVARLGRLYVHGAPLKLPHWVRTVRCCSRLQGEISGRNSSGLSYRCNTL